MAAAGQLPGASRAKRRAPHVAHQHGPCAARQSGRVRLRLHPGGTADRAHGERDRHHGDAGALRGPLLQLVRHPVVEAAVASLHLDRGQRQPRRPPADVAARTCSRSPTIESWTCDGSRDSAIRCARWAMRWARPCRHRSSAWRASLRSAYDSRRRDTWRRFAPVSRRGLEAVVARSRRGRSPRAPVRRVRHSGPRHSSRQCRIMALDELRVPRSVRRGSRSRRCASLRRCEAGLPARRRAPRDRADRAYRTPGDALRRARAAWSTTFSTTRRATCLPSATTSAERRLDASYYDLLASEAQARELRGDCAGTAAAGELVRARAPAHDGRRPIRCCCPGAARCSST